MPNGVLKVALLCIFIIKLVLSFPDTIKEPSDSKGITSVGVVTKEKVMVSVVAILLTVEDRNFKRNSKLKGE